KPAPERRVRQKRDAEFLAAPHDRDVIARPQRELALYAGHAMNRVRALELFQRDFREPDGLRFAGLDDFGHRPPRLFQRNFGIHPMTVIGVPRVAPEPQEAGVDGRAHVLRASVRLDVERSLASLYQSALRRHEGTLAHAADGPPDELFVGER